MSKTRYKIHIKCDSNTGTLEEFDIYRICNHSTDYQVFLDEDGDYVYLIGTDDFIKYLIEAIDTFEGEYFDSIGQGFSVKEIAWLDLPEKIRELYSYY